MDQQLTPDQITQIYTARPDVQTAMQTPSKMSETKRATNWYNDYLAGGGAPLFSAGGSYSGQNVVSAVTSPASPYNYSDPYGAYSAIGKTLGLDTATADEQAAQKALLDYQNTTMKDINTLRNNRDLSTGLEAGFESNRTREATAEEANLANVLTLAQQRRMAIESQVGQQYGVFQSELGKREELLAQAAQYGMKNVSINDSIDKLSSAVGIGQLMSTNPGAKIKEGDSIDSAFKKINDYTEEQHKQAYKSELKKLALQYGIKTSGKSTSALEKSISKYNKSLVDQTKKESDMKLEAAKWDIENVKSQIAERGKKGSGSSEKDIKSFFTDASKLRAGMSKETNADSWEYAWNNLRNKYPDASDQLIDQTLGLDLREKYLNSKL